MRNHLTFISARLLSVRSRFASQKQTGRQVSIAPLRRAVICVIVTLASGVAPAQILTTSFPTQTPVSDAGHNYIQDANEVVNPANGSVSIRIQAPTPTERALNHPIYAFRYDSASQFEMYFQPQLTDPKHCSYDPSNPASSIDPCIVTVVGPMRGSVQQVSQGSPYQLQGPNSFTWSKGSLTYEPNMGQPITCTYYTGYRYEDYSGEIHILGGVTTDQTEFNANTQCQNNYINVGDQPLAGDESIKLVIGHGASEQNLVRFADLSGTTVRMDGQYHSNLSTDITGPSEIPVVDRNGNAPSSTNRSGSYVGFDPEHPKDGPIAFPGIVNPYKYETEQVTSNWNAPTTDLTPNFNNGAEDLLCAADNGAAFLSGLTVVKTLILPNGQQYQFDYDPLYGLLTKVTYPTGAWTRYTWSSIPDASATAYSVGGQFQPTIGGTLENKVGQHDERAWNTQCYFRFAVPSITKREVSFDGQSVAEEQDFAYTTQWASSTSIYWTVKTTTVTTKDLTRPDLPSSDTVYTYSPLNVVSSPGDIQQYSQNTQEQTVVYKDYSGSILKTEVKSWAAPNQLASMCTIWPNGQISGEFYKYRTYYWDRSGFTASGEDVLANVTNLKTDIASYDYGILDSSCTQPSAAPSREEQIDYADFGNTTRWPTFTLNPNSGFGNRVFAPAAIYDRPSEIRTYQNGTLTSRTAYGYDEVPVASVNNAIGHDENDYGPTSTDPRGNLTSITRYCFIQNATCANSVSKATYDETGMMTSVTDPVGNQTSFSYVDAYVSDDGVPMGNTNTYVTKITRPSTTNGNHISNYQWDFRNGKLRVISDENSLQTLYTYNDPWNRATEVDSPDGGIARTSYNDNGPNPSVSTSVLMNSAGQYETSSVTEDGIGHVIQKASTSDPAGTTFVDFTYDGLGRVMTQSNPYRSSGDSTSGQTAMSYDALGRLTGTTDADANTVSTQYVGSTTLTTNEANVTSIYTDDAFGQLSSISEPTGAMTSYSYDGNNNLRSVVQSGIPGSETPRTRNFTYDSLSRLITSTNPETGTTCYGQWSNGACTGGYDANGNLLYKTDANGMTISYHYDALNRLIYKSAPDADNLQAWFGYDQGANGIGRLTSESRNGVAGEGYAYDAMGRVTSTVWVNYQAGNAVQPGMGVQYDLAGHPTQITYPDGRAVSQSWDGAGRLYSITDTANGNAYLSSTQYWPSGAIHGQTFGNGVGEGITINNRLQTCLEQATTPMLPLQPSGDNLLHRQIFHSNPIVSNCGNEPSNNGNIWSILEQNGTISQSFIYDGLNRLTSANSANRPPASTYNFTYNYDSFGNMLPTDNNHSNLNYSIDSLNRLRLNQGTTDDLQYDANGSLIQAPTGAGNEHTLLYTGEHYLRCIDSCQTGSYLTDAIGQRTYASSGSGVHGYVYLNGQPMAVLDNNGNWTDYVYANGQKIASVRKQEHHFHMSGTGSSPNWNNVRVVIPVPQDPNGGNYVVKTGDHLCWRQQSAVTNSGIAVWFDDNGRDSIAQGWNDQNGNLSYGAPPSPGWVNRCVDLTGGGQDTGAAILSFGTLTFNWVGGTTGFDAYFQDMSIISGEGIVVPIDLSNGGIFTNAFTGQLAAQQEIMTGVAPETHYYLADQVGTTQMELSEGGWPVWQGWFTPFGQEIVGGSTQQVLGQTPNDGTDNRCKFTGKERDTESGLDYFGARYYGSSMGRWMSPDYSINSVILELPQSWNKYSYVLNRPLYASDPDGRCPWCVGALVGGVVEGGFDFGKQLYNGASLSNVSWGEVGANVLGGAVAGAAAVGTGGLSLIGSSVADGIVGNTVGNVVGGVVTRAVDPNTSSSDVLSAGEISEDAVSGFVGGTAGTLAGEVVHVPDEPVRPDPRHQARTSVYNVQMAARNRAIVQQSIRSGIAGSTATHGTNQTSSSLGSRLWYWLMFSTTPPPPPQPSVTTEQGDGWAYQK